MTAESADPLTAMGVVDSNMVIESDSRRKPLGLWDWSGYSTRRLNQWGQIAAEPRQAQ